VATKAQLLRYVRGNGTTPPPTPGPAVVDPPTVTGADFQVGVELTATPPTYTPVDAVISGPVWRYSSGDTISGASGTTYTPIVGDIGKDIFVRYTLTAGGVTIDSDSAAVGPIAAVATDAPVIANQTLDFGRLTLAGAGGIAPTNTGGAITTGCSIDSGTNANHWQIDPLTGVITPSGISALSASYTLGCTFGNAAGTDTATITINTEANAYDVASTAEATAAFSAAGASGVISVDTCVWFRAGNTFSLTAGWFNNRQHTATMTIKSRVPWYSGTPAIIDTVGNVSGQGWTNLKFKDLQWTCRFLRENYGNTTYVIVITKSASGNSWGKVVWEDCDIAGDYTDLGPGQHFKGFYGVSNVTQDLTALDLQIIGTEPISTGNPLKSSLHGMWRMINPGVFTKTTGPGLNIKVTDTDIYDMGLDGLVVANVWTTVDLSRNYLHNPYMNTYRVKLEAANDVWKRTTAWNGAADGKKLFMIWSGQFQSVMNASANQCLYGQGTTADPRVKLFRDTTGHIVCTVADPAGANVVTLTSAQVYSGASFKLVVAISIDTDDTASMYIWKEQNGGGGIWIENVSDTVAGETLNLNSGPVSLGGTPDSTERAAWYYTRMFVWYGQAPDLTSSVVRDNIVDSTTGADVPVANLTALYGTPVLWQEGVTEYWNSTTSALGTGLDWTSVGAVEIDHGDLIQTLFGATVTGVTIDDNIMAAFFDVTPIYARPAWQDGLYNYYEMQGYFGEDMNADHYLEGASVQRNIVMVASGYAIAPYNAKDCTISDNVVVIPSEWGFTTANYPQIRTLANGSAPLMGGNTITNNWAYNYTLTVGGSGVANTLTPPNKGALVDPTNYGLYMIDGAAPTTRAEFVAYVAGAI